MQSLQMGFELQKNLHIIEKHMVEYNYRVKLNQQFSRHIASHYASLWHSKLVSDYITVHNNYWNIRDSSRSYNYRVFLQGSFQNVAMFSQAINFEVFVHGLKLVHTNCHQVKYSFCSYELLGRLPTSSVFFAPAQ